MKSVFCVFTLSALMFMSGCDSLDDVTACIQEFADYQDRAAEFENIEGTICDNQAAAQEFITFLETEAKGSCIEEELNEQDQDLDQIIVDAKAKLAACTN